ncbi:MULTISPECIES: type VII toxin-antitoxin system HepT family RNase toxin [Cytobacillus]|uniref:DUF86 domain-containing protein n=1 Tax=Cytobacillus kochii TaxID=859143 RepID=A0A248TPV4_9BACI|nr:DUF86 domain-containing protein [Cytobacillus kochii]ASV70140.1 hypothetical protein CKF48_22895 [Cytobacillus kochii]MDM5205314.1 DUF86 domain-containing protein [Cytobacillus kochii]MDQ0186702.1 uncharacterized protein YutE (UPF0331/DUF86 family) [Cytobacillus kochii]
MKSDVILNKVSTIERCINRIKEVYNHDPSNLQDYTKQDSIILNIQRACEAAIDLAMHVVSEEKLGLPQTSRDAFDMLEEHQMIDEPIARRLKAMVGFRNIAVHDYQSLNLDIMKEIIERHLDDFTEFTRHIIKA